MSGRTKGPNRGGRREGAGRKKQPRFFSDKIKSGLMKALKAKEKKTGKGWLDDLVDMNQDPNVQDSVRIAAKKLISEILVIKESHRTEEKRVYAPVVLPALEDDPSKNNFARDEDGNEARMEINRH